MSLVSTYFLLRPHGPAQKAKKHTIDARFFCIKNARHDIRVLTRFISTPKFSSIPGLEVSPPSAVPTRARLAGSRSNFLNFPGDLPEFWCGDLFVP